MSKHSKSKWEIDRTSTQDYKFTINQGSIEVKWGQIFKGAVITKEEAEANANRIVACVNACDEMHNPYFSIGQTKISLEQARNHVEELMDWKAQAEIAHKMMLEVVEQKDILIEGLINEYKDFIANCEAPPTNKEFLIKASNLISKNKKQPLKTEQI